MRKMSALLATSGFGYVLQYAPLSLSLSTLYFKDSDAPKRGCVKTPFSLNQLSFVKNNRYQRAENSMIAIVLFD